MSETLTREQELKRLSELIGRISYAMLTTVNSEGSLESRPMETLKLPANRPFDGTLWFFTSDNSPKTDQVKRDQHVNLAYCDPAHHRFASLQGTATLVRDREKFEELWTPTQMAWFPGGLADPHLALLRVDVKSAQYWDSPGKSLQFLKWAKAVVTKNPKAAEDVHKIDVKKTA